MKENKNIRKVLWGDENSFGVLEDLRRGVFSSEDLEKARKICKILRDFNKSLSENDKEMIGTAEVLDQTLRDSAFDEGGMNSKEDQERLETFLDELQDNPILYSKFSIGPNTEDN